MMSPQNPSKEGCGQPVAAAMVSTFQKHTCALRSDGSTFCWGENHSGQLGNGEAGGAENKFDSGIDSSNPISVK